ncbi:LacI family DNA-binding transcriptional regulator [Hymenobacter sp. PAMC 26628]|uniref:LacI family DNA-binding transcriptional regulator n=1 Tax=Hymenobacter sp. PAMC 26628 TaxID=1484118 RepID=UPI0007702732|nr:LacI family DNA-binding transcriptional regulator [Hymenobacter sp. PAMC 26628]AMJ67506.1 LacI family transcriptional regulator [Hymenobacter sp. PAMC 26628]
MKSTPVTLKAIARELNISLSTVSRALRGMPEVHADTRAAVHRLAAELDYQPNQLATNLAHSRTKTIGVLMPSLSYHFYSALLSSIEDAAMLAGYSVLVCQSNESHLREITNIQNLMRSQVEGFLIALSRDTSSYEHIERLTRKNFPLVLFDRCADGIAASKVIIDNEAAAFNATEHLIEQGCQRIGFLAGPPNLLISSQRVAGYQAALARHGLPARREHLLHCDFTQEDAIAQTQKLLSQRQLPDGLLVVSDRVAFPAMYTLKQRGVRIPQDLAIASFNNEPFAALQTPGLTSVSQPLPEMGIETVRLLLRQLDADHEQPPLETKVLGTQLVIRESSLRNALP